MAAHFPIVFEREDSGVVSAYVAGLPVYAQGATRSKAAAAIVRTLRAYMDAHPPGGVLVRKCEKSLEWQPAGLLADR